MKTDSTCLGRRLSHALMWLGLLGCTAQAGQFEVLGIPVKTTMVTASAVGLDEHGQEVLYFDCAQPGNHLFLLQVNPASGAVHQWSAPVGEGAWAMCIGPDQRVYLGTWEGGHLLQFDPKHPDKGIVSLGKPSASETYIWQLAAGADGCLYGCTYPGAKLVRFNPATGASADLGRLDPKEMYARSVVSSTNGSLYIGIGTVRAQVVRYEPKSGERQFLFAEPERPAGTAQVFCGPDGQAYASAANRPYRCETNRLEPISALPSPTKPRLRDGRELASTRVERGALTYTLLDSKGHSSSHSVPFEGAGLRLFALGAGPEGRVFGSTVLPLELFEFNPRSKALTDLGNPSDVGGELYSFAQEGPRLYVCAYPQSFLSVYEPQRPWHYGKATNSNPRGLGRMGDGHLRPRAMLVGPDKRVYVGSLPPYGQVGGALGIFDPKANAVTENYRHVVTNQGISALAYEPQSKRLFGGSSIGAGGGARAVAKECVVFAWDIATHQKQWEQVIVPGDSSVAALSVAHGKLFGVTLPSSTLFVLDAKELRVLQRTPIPYGKLQEISLDYYPPHDRLYGLAGQSIIAIEPASGQISQVALSPEPINCGFALTDSGLYFGSGTRLVRWVWDGAAASPPPKPAQKAAPASP